MARMKTHSVGIVSAFLAVGLAGSAAAYRAASADAPDTRPKAVVAAAPRPKAPAQVVRPATRFRWAPCAAGAHLEHGVCVTVVVRTVVVPAAPAPAVPGQAAAPSSPGAQQVVQAQAPVADDSGSDDAGRERGDGDGDRHHDDDHDGH
ncbi:hypothetical protein GCM10027601_04150 [Nocardioides ungokensis]